MELQPLGSAPGSALVRALDHLASEVRAARSRNDLRVPPLPRLASGARVSQTTMVKALARFREQGVVTVSRGRGVRVAPVADIPAPPGPVRSVWVGPKWRRLAGVIRADIATGRYASEGSLPSAKELAVRHDVCGRTLRKALALLAAEGVIEERRRGHGVAAVRHGGSGNTVVLVLRGDSFGEPSIMSPRSRDNLRELEGACSRSGARLEIVTCYYIMYDLQGIDHIRRILGDPSLRADILGFMVWTMGLEQGYLRRLLEVVEGARLPVAVLDETDAAGSMGFAPGERTRMFVTAMSTTPGRVMARYLHRLGHRHVAFIADSPLASWARARWQGMVREYEAMQAPGGVRLLVPGHARAPTPVEALTTDRDKVLEMLVPRYIERTQGEFSVRERIAVRIAEEITEARSIQNARDQLFPALEGLVRDEAVTAWVGASDSEALACLDFLRLNGIAVPGRISVAGFDDGYPAFSQKLTSYNFNGRAYMHAMLDYVLRPAAPGDRRPAGPVEFEGYVSERATVGRVAGE